MSLNTHAADCKVGDKAKVKWKSWIYPATVTRKKEDKCCIHYDGWNKKWDECVSDSRITITGSDMPFKRGENVQILWKGKYYPGSITSLKGSNYCITYKGYSKSWDECVNPSRIRQ